MTKAKLNEQLSQAKEQFQHLEGRYKDLSAQWSKKVDRMLELEKLVSTLQKENAEIKKANAHLNLLLHALRPFITWMAAE